MVTFARVAASYGVLAIICTVTVLLLAHRAPAEKPPPVEPWPGWEKVCAQQDCDGEVYGSVSGFPFCWPHYAIHESARIDATLRRGSDWPFDQEVS